VFHPEVVQGSVGTLFQVALAEASAGRAAAWLRRCGLRIVAASPAGATPYWSARYDGGVAIVVGSERHGVGQAWLEAADEVVSIPMGGVADSLNVAVAAGILLFEAARRRQLGATASVVRSSSDARTTSADASASSSGG
jgi:TrmH family RNA methyltransferase